MYFWFMYRQITLYWSTAQKIDSIFMANLSPIIAFYSLTYWSYWSVLSVNILVSYLLHIYMHIINVEAYPKEGPLLLGLWGNHGTGGVWRAMNRYMNNNRDISEEKQTNQHEPSSKLTLNQKLQILTIHYLFLASWRRRKTNNCFSQALN